MNRSYFAIFLAACSCSLAATATANDTSVAISSGGGAFSLHVTADDNDAPATVATPEVDLDEPVESFADPFIPDVYPSAAEAARGLAERWAAQAAHAGSGRPATVRVMSDDPALYAPVEQAVRTALRGEHVERCDGRLCKEHTDPPGDETWLYIELPGRNGTVSLRAAGAAGATLVTKFVDKAWVSEFPRFAAAHPGRWLVAHSDPDRPAGSSSEAGRGARVNAARDLVPLLRARLGRCDEGELHRLVEMRLLGDQLVHDRFPQRYERPYGKVFREAVLIDASDNRLDRLAGELRGSMDMQRESRVKGFVSAAAVLLVTYALYRFANAFTRGYFTWSLRTAAAVVAAGAVMLIVAVA